MKTCLLFSSISLCLWCAASSAPLPESRDTVTGDMLTDLAFEHVAECSLGENTSIGTDTPCLYRGLAKTIMRMSYNQSSDEHGYGGFIDAVAYYEGLRNDTASDEEQRGEFSCHPPIHRSALPDLVSVIAEECMQNDESVTSDDFRVAVADFESIVDSTECWESLCSEEGKMKIRSSWLGECAGIDVPLLPKEDSGISDEGDVKVACMLQHVMTAHPSEYGQNETDPESVESCYLPGHLDMANSCPSVIGPIALEHCRGTVPPPDNNRDDDVLGSYWYGKDFSLSYKYQDDLFDFPDQSMSYPIRDDDVHDDDTTNDQIYLDKFCSLMVMMSSEAGKYCLKEICPVGRDIRLEDDDDDDDDTDWSQSPTEIITRFPSTAPTITHTRSPSMTPSSFPTTIPSSMPSPFPSNAPTATVIEPTRSPTASPTVPIVVSFLEVKFEAGLTMGGLKKEDIPTAIPALKKMAGVLLTVITKLLPEGSSAKIISIAGIRVDGLRRLRRTQGDGQDTNGTVVEDPDTDAAEGEDVEVVFEVTTKVECESDCAGEEETSMLVYDEVAGDLADAVASGSLEEEIKKEASTAGVVAFDNVTIASDSFTAEEPVTIIKKAKVSGGGDDDDDSGAGFFGTKIPILVVLGVCSSLYTFY